MPDDDHTSGIDSERPRSTYRKLAVAALLASILTLAGLWMLAAILWHGLPDRFPVHFNLKGEPDGFVRKEYANWYMLPLTGAGTTALLLGLTFVIRPFTRGEAKWLNVPRKKDFLKLPPEARERALAPLYALIWGSPAPVNLVFTYVVSGMYSVATKRTAGLSMIPMIVGLALVFAWTGLGIMGLRRAIIDEAAKLPRAEGGD